MGFVACLVGFAGFASLAWLLKATSKTQEANIVTRATAAIVGESKTGTKSNWLNTTVIFLVLVLLMIIGYFFMFRRKPTTSSATYDIEEGYVPSRPGRSYRSNLEVSG